MSFLGQGYIHSIGPIQSHKRQIPINTKSALPNTVSDDAVGSSEGKHSIAWHTLATKECYYYATQTVSYKICLWTARGSNDGEDVAGGACWEVRHITRPHLSGAAALMAVSTQLTYSDKL